MVSAQVARDVERPGSTSVCVRGYVARFIEERGRWALVFTDDYRVDADIDELNTALQRRYDHDHGADGLGSEPPFRRTRKNGPNENSSRRKQLDELLKGIDPNWRTSQWIKFVYDHWHFLKNWFCMVAADKHSDIARVRVDC